MSESKPGPGPDDPSYYAPRRLRDLGSAADNDWRTSTGPQWPTSPPPDAPVPQVPAHVPPPNFRLSKDSESRAHGRTDAFNDALAKALREQLEAENARSGVARQRRSNVRALSALALAFATAGGLVTLTYLAMFSPPPGLSGSRLWAALGSWQAKRVPAPPPRAVSTLYVRNQRGLVNEPLELGVSVIEPAPGATVAIRGTPAGVMLTSGQRTSASDWRLRADEVSDAKVVPPDGFLGDMNLAVELHDADGAALVTSNLQLTWKAPPPRPAEAVALSTAAAPPVAPAQPAAAPPAPVLTSAQMPSTQMPSTEMPSTQTPSTQMASAPQTAQASSPPPSPLQPATEPPADPVRQMTPNEIAIAIRRAEELLATGDVKAARALLLRAAQAHDARAALALAKTFDPAVSQSSLNDMGGPDPAQARNWYQKAREWGSPEAQRLLDALASYRR